MLLYGYNELMPWSHISWARNRMDRKGKGKVKKQFETNNVQNLFLFSSLASFPFQWIFIFLLFDCLTFCCCSCYLMMLMLLLFFWLFNDWLWWFMMSIVLYDFVWFLFLFLFHFLSVSSDFPLLGCCVAWNGVMMVDLCPIILSYPGMVMIMMLMSYGR